MRVQRKRSGRAMPTATGTSPLMADSGRTRPRWRHARLRPTTAPMTRLAIVTGTSRGIGLAVARALLEKGWTVVGAARHEPEGLAHERYRHEPLDLADLPAVGRFYARLEPQLRAAARVGLVNNAAVLAPVAPIPELTPAELTNAYAVNVVAPVWLAGAFVRAVEAAPLRIVDLSSGAATSARAGARARERGASA